MQQEHKSYNFGTSSLIVWCWEVR